MIKSERRTKARTILYSGALWLGGQTTVPAGSDLSAVTTLRLWGQATVPAGSDLSAVTTLELGDQATVPAGSYGSVDRKSVV